MLMFGVWLLCVENLCWLCVVVVVLCFCGGYCMVLGMHVSCSNVGCWCLAYDMYVWF